ncbi:cytochrome P450 [Micromonospora sp. NPDC048830]|uniref:cytochrome P450 n=1 Tax=Micromonospora sp. NPDC048830 TaxID=3364257 RepID=UPI003719077A
MERKKPDLCSLVDGATYRDGNPFDTWRWLRENEPVAWQNGGEFGDFWSVTRHADVDRVLRDPDTFSSSSGILLRPQAMGADPGGNRTLALSDAPRHGVLRKAVSSWFAPRNLRSLAESLTAMAREDVAAAVRRRDVDFVADVAAKLPVEVAWIFLGIPEKDRPALTRWSLAAFCSDSAVERTVAHLEILDYFHTLADARRARPADDLVSVLSRVEVDGRLLPLDEVVLNCDNLLVGSTENVRLAMAGGVQALLDRASLWQRVRREPDRLMPTLVEEMLRWTSSATHLVRTARRDVELGGQRIGAGQRVVLWLPSANRDPIAFDAPEVFDVARSPNRHIALGAGPHYCLGVQLARLEIQAVVAELIRSVGRLQANGEPERLESIVVNGYRTLPIRLEAEEIL